MGIVHTKILGFLACKDRASLRVTPFRFVKNHRTSSQLALASAALGEDSRSLAMARHGTIKTTED